MTHGGDARSWLAATGPDGTVGVVWSRAQYYGERGRPRVRSVDPTGRTGATHVLPLTTSLNGVAVGPTGVTSVVVGTDINQFAPREQRYVASSSNGFRPVLPPKGFGPWTVHPTPDGRLIGVLTDEDGYRWRVCTIVPRGYEQCRARSGYLGGAPAEPVVAGSWLVGISPASVPDDGSDDLDSAEARPTRTPIDGGPSEASKELYDVYAGPLTDDDPAVLDARGDSVAWISPSKARPAQTNDPNQPDYRLTDVVYAVGTDGRLGPQHRLPWTSDVTVDGVDIASDGHGGATLAWQRAYGDGQARPGTLHWARVDATGAVTARGKLDPSTRGAGDVALVQTERRVIAVWAVGNRSSSRLRAAEIAADGPHRLGFAGGRDELPLEGGWAVGGGDHTATITFARGQGLLTTRLDD